MIVPLQFVIAFVMALLVNATLHGRGLILFVFILPLAVSDLAAGLVWQQIFTDHGYLNTILQHLGIIDQPKIWIDPSHSNWLLGEVVLTEMWRSTAFIMIILVAGLQGIPKEFGEAAEVFGAGFFQRIRNVTLPMLKPALQVALLFRIIFAFEVFASVIAITGRAKTTLAGESLRWQSDYLDPHVASAYALLILVLSLVAAGIAVRALRTPKEQAAAMSGGADELSAHRGSDALGRACALRARVHDGALGDPARSTSSRSARSRRRTPSTPTRGSCCHATSRPTR